VEDDGAGFDFSAIREAAIANGLAAKDIVNQMSKGELVRFVFVSGFTTQDETNIDAGRGVGLDVVKDSVARLGGKIGIKSSCGLSSQVTIRLPRRMLTMIEQPLPELVLTEKIAGF
jgi:chemotaxis protein histidine kinase CheA